MQLVLRWGENFLPSILRSEVLKYMKSVLLINKFLLKRCKSAAIYRCINLTLWKFSTCNDSEMDDDGSSRNPMFIQAGVASRQQEESKQDKVSHNGPLRGHKCNLPADFLKVWNAEALRDRTRLNQRKFISPRRKKGHKYGREEIERGRDRDGISFKMIEPFG